MRVQEALLVSCLTVLPPALPVDAQPAGKIVRVGYLLVPRPGPATDAFRDGLRQLGYVEGQNLVFELRSAEGRAERLPQLAQELVGLGVDVLVVAGTPAALAAKQATTTIPIVTTLVAEAVESGLVASLARPGGNVTGMSWVGPEMIGKPLELIKEILPGVSRVGFMWNPDILIERGQFREFLTAARALSVRVQSLEVRSLEDVERAFTALVAEHAEALVATSSNPAYAHRRVLGALALRHRLPVASVLREMADAGVLVVYGPIQAAMSRRAAGYVDRILKGARPADLPMERPDRFEIVVNLATAKALGITVPRRSCSGPTT